MLDALGKSDVFKDMSGKEGTAGIVQELVKGAIELEKEKLKQKGGAGVPPSGGVPAGGPLLRGAGERRATGKASVRWPRDAR